MALAATNGCDPGDTGGDPSSELHLLTFPDTTTLGGSGAVGPEAFGRIRGVALLSDEERLVVADGQTQEVHLFTVGGEHLRTAGGRGGGPGESQAIRDVWGTVRGGFCTWDAQTRRVTEFDDDGGVVATGRADVNGMESIFPSFAGFLDDCSFILRDGRSAMDMAEVAPGLRRDTVRYVLFGRDGSPGQTILRRPNVERWFRNRDRSRGYVDPIFGEALFGFPVGQEFWVGTSDVLTWTRLDLLGDTVGTVELSHTARRATVLEVAAERERRIGAARVPNVPIGPPEVLERLTESRQDGIRDVMAREYVPAYDAISRGTRSTFWIREYPRPTDTLTTWYLVSPTGERLGSVVTLRADSIVAGSKETLVIQGRDAFTAPLLHILRQQESRGGARRGYTGSEVR